jgi:DNA-binding transcriptional LysR family regulator
MPNRYAASSVELRHLRYFVVVAEEEHFTRAAERLHLSQPPLSRQIKELEEELGVDLFERTPNSIRLTRAGKIFLKDARAILRKAEDAKARVLVGKRHERIDVGYAPSLASDFLMRAMSQLAKVAPRVRVMLHDLATQEASNLMLAGKLDLAIGVPPARLPARKLRFDAITSFPSGLLLARTHALAALPRVPLARLRHEPFLSFDRKLYPEYWHGIVRFCAKHGFRPKLAREFDGAASLLAAATAGEGVAIVTRSLLGAPLEGVRFVDVEPETPRVPVGVLRHVGKEPPRVAQLAQLVADAARARRS